MLQTNATAHLDDLMVQARGSYYPDARQLHDDLQQAVSNLEARHLAVPHDVRETLADLEAEIAEEFFDNLPI